MAAVRPIRKQSYEQIYVLLKTAIIERSCISLRYQAHLRLMCPYILGRTSDGRPQLLAYQYGGESSSGLGKVGSPDNWRCVAVEKLSDVKLIAGRWITPPGHAQPQSCVAVVEFDVNKPHTFSKGASD